MIRCEQRRSSMDPANPHNRECGTLPSANNSTTTRRTGNHHRHHWTEPPDSFSEAFAVPDWSPVRGPKRGTERTSADSWQTYFPSLLLGRAGRPKMRPQISPTNTVRKQPHLYDQTCLNGRTGSPPEQKTHRKHTAEAPPTLFAAPTPAGAHALQPSHEPGARTVRSHVPLRCKKV